MYIHAWQTHADVIQIYQNIYFPYIETVEHVLFVCPFYDTQTL